MSSKRDKLQWFSGESRFRNTPKYSINFTISNAASTRNYDTDLVDDYDDDYDDFDDDYYSDYDDDAVAATTRKMHKHA